MAEKNTRFSKNFGRVSPFVSSVLMVSSLIFVAQGYAGSKKSPQEVATDQMVREVTSIAQEMRDSGRLSSKTKISGGKLTHSNGSAMFNTVTQTCELEVTANPQNDDYKNTAMPIRGANPNKDPLWLRYMTYHEMGHCQLFDKPQGLFAYLQKSGVSPSAIRMADDVILLDTIVAREGSREGTPLSVVTLTHEVYADARAVMFMVQDGYTAKQLNFILRSRQDNPMDKIHDSGAVVAAILAMDPVHVKAMNAKEVDTEARRLAVLQALDKTLGQSGVMGHGDGYFLDVNLRYQIDEIQTMLKENSLAFTDFLLQASMDKSSNLKQYDALVWLSTKGRAIASTSTQQEFFAAWVKDLYQIDEAQYAIEAKQTALRIERDATAHKLGASSVMAAR